MKALQSSVWRRIIFARIRARYYTICHFIRAKVTEDNIIIICARAALFYAIFLILTIIIVIVIRVSRETNRYEISHYSTSVMVGVNPNKTCARTRDVDKSETCKHA